MVKQVGEAMRRHRDDATIEFSYVESDILAETIRAAIQAPATVYDCIERQAVNEPTNDYFGYGKTIRLVSAARKIEAKCNVAHGVDLTG